MDIVFYNFKKYKHTCDIELETTNKNNITNKKPKNK